MAKAKNGIFAELAAMKFESRRSKSWFAALPEQVREELLEIREAHNGKTLVFDGNTRDLFEVMRKRHGLTIQLSSFRGWLRNDGG